MASSAVFIETTPLRTADFPKKIAEQMLWVLNEHGV
jgi:hypothetical protein